MNGIPVILDTDRHATNGPLSLFLETAPEIDLLGLIIPDEKQVHDNFYDQFDAAEPICRDIPKAIGYGAPIRKKQNTEQCAAGSDGIVRAADFISDIIKKTDEKVNIITCGPLTDMAIFLLSYPELKGRINNICILGGAILTGDATPIGEYNICRDPEAASIVFDSGAPITMFGLELQQKVLMTKQEKDLFRNAVNNCARFGEKNGSSMHEFIESWIHTAIPVMYLLNPRLFKTQACHVEVDLYGEYTRGSTVVDLLHISEHPANVNVVLDVDRENFFKSLRAFTTTGECLKS